MGVSWQALFLMRVLLANVLAIWVIKRVAQLPQRTSLLILQYSWLALASGLWWVYNTPRVPSGSANLIIVLGAFNSFACYAQWRAFDISLSRAAIFSILDDLIALGLAYIFLGEISYLNPLLTTGILLSFISAVMLSLPRSTTSGSVPQAIIYWVLLYSVIWGITAVATRFFAYDQTVPIPTFVFFWYAGSLIGALLMQTCTVKTEQPIMRSAHGLVALLAGLVFGTTVLTYMLFTRTPVTVLQPLSQLAELIFPLLMGVFVFRESRELINREWIAIAIGVVGGVLVGCAL